MSLPNTDQGVIMPEERFILFYRLLLRTELFIATVEDGGADEWAERYRELKDATAALAASIDAAMPAWAKGERTDAENGDVQA